MELYSSSQVEILLFLTWSVLSICIGEIQIKHEDIGTPLSVVGCFQKDHDYRDLPFNITNAVVPLSAESCKAVCKQKFFRYAFFKNAQACYCDSSYGRYHPAECLQSCNANETGSCEGSLSNAVLDTGWRVPGPPTSLKLFNATVTSVQAVWTPPAALNDVFTEYIVVADCINTYSTITQLEPRQWVFPNSTLKAGLPDLHPGSLYNISVATHSDHVTGVKVSDTIWTQIGEPEEPEVPRILRRDKGQILVQLSPVINENGPITAYRIVVVYEAGREAFRKDLLKSFHEAEFEGLSYYIAAELKPQDLKDEFVVGDGRTYGNYYNPPLPLDYDVHVTLGVVSSLNNVTKVTYAHLGHVVLNIGDNVPVADVGGSGLVIGLSVAIGVFGFILLLSVVAYCMLRRHLGRRRLNSDHQELSLQGPMIEVEPNGYIHNGFIPEEEDERVNHYENLKRQVWNIPRNFLDVKSDVLGQGQYGNVMRGTVQQRGFPIPVAIHTIADGDLPPDKKRSMLRDLGVLIRLGTHENIASLVGTCENPDTLFVVVEHHPASLKDVLVESRCLERSIAPYSVQVSVSDVGRSKQRICSLSERQILEAAVGIARAMDYLTSKKIIHTKLAARNVLMVDGVVPKVTGCGIARYNKCREKPDYTRWTAQEIFRGRPHVNKSDVWSFACVLWEISALGGTPYADVATSDVGSRVMRGHRLPQLQCVDDDLYQLMLQCWQLDLDERPTFREITHILENMLDDSMIHLNFEMYAAGFHYEQYIPELEQVQT
ncbi:putative tyrosine-protein kinase Wsck isoform X2 [Zootermopsis nevadensis]|uniref:Putative tyrosine-protein kinase Wsck n=2 Tax=Zootermopsis nevadensis TaxID=136037 RepID=A0A067QZ76_ZOONE|nr:putative tyrosine-protein kinase Wsck isoform X2 [Zootermopsis nevadensis]XP_021926592.1 putative tyrosine-protein kinase Wsck isoform X2 [Zootermopsis nevadensis]XP_021926593.1 putative tyrosine-protein kinase Wsck isoform X2 [Zootermopsis nevadensis]KDR15852.1 Putative tyrosine-protein kinase Wsck [Zootermopsis nevadensis]